VAAVIVRPASDRDIPAIAEIYGYHVRNGFSSFEMEAPDAKEMMARRQEIVRRGLPYLVAEREGAVVAYAYASPYRARPGYRFSLEDSIYVDPSCLGQGIGRILLPGLIEACEQTGARQLIAVIGDSGNAASIRLHEKFGFAHVGVLRSVGFKLGRWVDTVLMQRGVAAGDSTLPNGERGLGRPRS
jgi:L-amino acid N-acyltransferase YncA